MICFSNRQSSLLPQASPIRCSPSTSGTQVTFYAGAELRYDYKNIFSFSAAGVYRSWDTKDDSQPTGNYALAYKPAFEANLHIDIRPISSVLLSLGYQHVSREKVEESKVDAVNNLYLGGTYEFSERNIRLCPYQQFVKPGLPILLGIPDRRHQLHRWRKFQILIAGIRDITNKKGLFC